MKKSILFILAVLTLSSANAQINRGAWLLGASSALGFNSYSYKNSSGSTQLNLALKAGYFVAKNWAVGADINYISLSQSGNSESISSLGVFTRYYIPKNFFLGAGLGTGNNTSKSGSISVSSSSTTIPFEFGFAGFITPNIAIEPSVNYTVYNDKTPYSTSSIFGINLGLSIYLNRNTEK